MDYEFVFKFYKSFCTKLTDIKDFFTDESTFIFTGDSGKVCISYGKDEIRRVIDEQFWSTDEPNFEKTLIAYNINIENKSQKLCLKSPQLNGNSHTEVIATIIGCLKAIHSEEDIKLTKAIGRRFFQSFIIVDKNGEQYISSSVFAYLAPTTDMFDSLIKNLLPDLTGDPINGITKANDSTESVSDMNFKKMVQNIDKMIDESVDPKDELCPHDIESIANELMPISVNELLEESLTIKKSDDIRSAINFEQYLTDIWNETRNSLPQIQETDESLSENTEKREADNHIVANNNDDSNTFGTTSFADVLRDGLQSWQNIIIDEKPTEFKVIGSYHKSKSKHNTIKGFVDKKSEFVGQQTITVIGDQNLEEIASNQIIFVANIPYCYPKNTFRSLFDIYGKVLSVKFIDRFGISFAFIYFDSTESVDKVMKSSIGNNLFLNGLQLKVDRYKPRASAYISN